jgi:hypothetical protein
VDSINVECQGCVLKRFERSAAIERLERFERASVLSGARHRCLCGTGFLDPRSKSDFELLNL